MNAADADNLTDGRRSCVRAQPAAAWLPAVRCAKQRRLTQVLGTHRLSQRGDGVYAPHWLGDVVTLPRQEWAALQKRSSELNLQLGRSCTAGFGLFATAAIKQDTLVAEYIGVVCIPEPVYNAFRPRVFLETTVAAAMSPMHSVLLLTELASLIVLCCTLMRRTTGACATHSPQ